MYESPEVPNPEAYGELYSYLPISLFGAFKTLIFILLQIIFIEIVFEVALVYYKIIWTSFESIEKSTHREEISFISRSILLFIV